MRKVKMVLRNCCRCVKSTMIWFVTMTHGKGERLQTVQSETRLRMSESLKSHDRNHTEPPLWSIGMAVLIVLLAPIVLYSFAPAGPIREGDTVFSEGQQQVTIQRIASDQETHDKTCLLDPNSPLIVIHSSNTDADGSIIAHVQGNPSAEWPFCPVHAEVQLKLHQVFQKPTALRTVRNTLSKWFGR